MWKTDSPRILVERTKYVMGLGRSPSAHQSSLDRLGVGFSEIYGMPITLHSLIKYYDWHRKY